MGMSASQARLLSITARLTNNEYKAQTITNSKLRLATETEHASQAYMDAMASQKMQYVFYNDNGEAQKMELTPAIVYEYSPMKNQYAMKDVSGRILVTKEDASNYKETNDLYEFLGRYNLTSNALYEKYQNDYNEWQAEHERWYNEEYLPWQSDYNNWVSEYNSWLDDKAAYDEELKAYQEYLNSPDVYQMFESIVRDSNGQPKDCYQTSLSGLSGANCYNHVLAHILTCANFSDYTNFTDFNSDGYTFETSVSGLNVKVERNDLSGSNIHFHGETETFKDISIQVKKEEDFCDGDDNFNQTGIQNILKDRNDAGDALSNADILKSDYIYTYDENTGEETYTLKSLKQKAIDLLYMIKNKNTFFTSDDEIIETLRNFTEGDMKRLEKEAPTLRPAPTIRQKPSEPQEPEPPENVFLVRDQDKAQWYTNLWFMMNGSDTANLVDPINFEGKDGYFKSLDEKTKEEYRFCLTNVNRDEFASNFDVFDDNLYTSDTWLQFALKHGVVTLDRAQFVDPSENSEKVPQANADAITWKSIPYSSAVDIVTVDDEKKIAAAEAQYKRSVQQIQHKDKKFDQDLKRLDTEHNALITEYESIKESINKNTERSFKAFS